MSTQAYAGTMTAGAAVARTVETPRVAAQERVSAPGATASVVCGVIGLFVFGIILGSVAIAKAASAKQLLAEHPDLYTGNGKATTGMVLGVIDVVGAIVALIMIMGS
jgi:hypothetical protein